MALTPQSGNSGFNLGGFIILAALGTFIWKGAPLDSVRPSNDQSNWSEHMQEHQVPARLWQDPFRAVHSNEKTSKSNGSQKSKLISKTIEEIDFERSDAEVTLLMVLVQSGSYAVQEERRRRRRYAVLSGLGEEYFVPRNPEMLNVFYHSHKHRRKDLDSCPNEKNTAEATKEEAKTKAENCSEQYAIPYEWYDYENPKDGSSVKRKVMVLWLDESHYSDAPLDSIKNFLSVLLGTENTKKNKINVTVLGPAGSDTLRNLVRTSETKTEAETDIYEWIRCQSGLSEFNILSSVATVDDEDLVTKKGTLPLTELQEKIKGVAQCDKGDTQQTKINFLRTIRSDKVLIKELARELKENRKIDSQDDYVVVISESDTYFGRSLPRAFEEQFCESGDCGKYLVRYHYQRGIDGIAAGKKGSFEHSGNNVSSKPNGLSHAADARIVRRPVGTGQFDYLRRLAIDIRKKDNEWRLQTGRGVRAVVLLGSDVYDKLLILRALRPELPAAIFATTDLDAQLIHPAEYSWTRNMIVASTYGLSLSSQVPTTIMPFRDSYQTSIYLATRLSFNEEMQKEVGLSNDNSFLIKGVTNTVQQTLYKKIPSQLIEVGRQTIVHLPDSINGNGTWNHVHNPSLHPGILLGITVIVLLAIFSLHQLRPKAGRVIVVLLFLLLLFSALSIWISNYGVNGEPLEFLAGASIWPAIYIRLFSVVLALTYIWTVIYSLDNNWKMLKVRFFKVGEEPDDEGLTLYDIWVSFKALFQDLDQWPQKFFSDKNLQLLMILMIIVVMIAVMKTVSPIKLPLDEKIGLLVAVWGVLIVFWWMLIYGKLFKSCKVLSVNKWNADRILGNKDAVEMWNVYGAYGAGNHRFLRSIAYIIMYFAFASILFTLLGPPTSPCRGDFACALDKTILGFSVLSMLVLLFLVVDAARLCICWVDSMHKYDLDWSKTRKDDFIKHLRLPDSHAVAWMKIHLIGERTNEVTKLIYFPVLIILLLLLARSTYFDNWDFPQALAIVIGLNFIIALGSVVRLNFVAQSTRDDILRKLQYEQMIADRPEAKSYEPTASERQELIHQLESLRIGAYLRVWDQPPVRATLMLLGGVALTYAEYLTVFLNG